MTQDHPDAIAYKRTADAFRTGDLDLVKTLIPPETLTPSLFFAIFVTKRQFRIAEFPVTHRERNTGLVSIRRWRLLKFCARALRQLMVFRWRLARAD